MSTEHFWLESPRRLACMAIAACAVMSVSAQTPRLPPDYGALFNAQKAALSQLHQTLWAGREPASFEPGQFVEGIAQPAQVRDGLFVTLLTAGRLVRVAADGTTHDVFRFPIQVKPNLIESDVITTVTRGPDGAFWIPVNSVTPELHGVWRIEASGTGRRAVTVPVGSQLNGVTWLGQRLLVADSANGAIYIAPLESGIAELWVSDSLLAGKNGLPGINGVQVRGGELFATNSSQATLLRIAVTASGKPLAPRIVTTEM